MQQLTFVAAGKLEWRDVPDPSIEGPGEALVRPLAVATCDLDLMLVRGKAPAGREFAFGHECVAEVIEVGEGVTDFAPGDVVSVPFQISCGSCERCRRGQTGNCESVPFLSSYGLPLGPDNGGFVSDSARVPYADAMLAKIPEGIEPEAVASLSDNIPDAWRTVGPQLGAEPGSPVLICAGAGSIAVYAAAIARALGSSRVSFAGGREHEREMAATLGVELLEQEFPKRHDTYPITVDASGDVDGLACALRSTEADGICTSIGIYFSPTTPVPLLEMYTKGIRFQTGRVHARPALEPILDLVRSGSFEPQLVTRETASFDDAAEAVAGHSGKLVISR